MFSVNFCRITGLRPFKYDFLRWRAIGRLEVGPFQAEGARLLQVARMWSPGCEINSKPVVLSPGRWTRTSQLALDLGAMSGRQTLHRLRPMSSLVCPFDYILQEGPVIEELKKSVADTTIIDTCSFFSDELKCSKQRDSRRIFMWRENGDRFYPFYTTKINRFGGKGILVCGGIMWGNRTPLKMFKNCRKEDLRIVALELEDVEFVKELIQYTIEDCKKAEEDRKKAEEGRKKAEEGRKKAEEGRKKAEEDRKRAEEDRKRDSLEKEVASHISVRAGNDWFRPLELAKEIDLYNTSRGKSLKPSQNVLPRNNSVKNTSRYLLAIKKRVTLKQTFFVPTITEDLVPTTKIDSNLNNIPNLKLADKNFNIPERVQMLLGAEVFYELMLPGQFKMEGSNVIFQNTVFGFIVSGSTSADAKGKEHCGFIQAANNLEHSIKKFWEIENVETDSIKTSELDVCEDHFKHTHSRDDQGR
ncbi:integrase catalytic domain-containing protein [Trichonephila clavipes]|nr:integrase catalytic domain-containing protein [Trichonephila clavipes]